VLASEPAIAADRDHHELVDKMIQEARRIARLVDDLLAFGRERPLEKRHADVVDLVTTLVADLQRGLALAETGAMPVPIRVHVAARVRADPVWDVDQEALRRVVGNLVRNAHEAVRGRLDREAHDGIDVRLARGSDWLEIAVEDQGVGIAEDKLPRVREAFYTTRHGGTGLGLAICDRIVRQHHGELRLSSQLGAGTTVTVRLPP
jgi:signal transduction histidine kinase